MIGFLPKTVQKSGFFSNCKVWRCVYKLQLPSIGHPRLGNVVRRIEDKAISSKPWKKKLVYTSQFSIFCAEEVQLYNWLTSWANPAPQKFQLECKVKRKPPHVINDAEKINLSNTNYFHQGLAWLWDPNAQLSPYLFSGSLLRLLANVPI